MFCKRQISIELFYLYQRMQCFDNYFFKIKFVFFVIYYSQHHKRKTICFDLFLLSEGVPNTSNPDKCQVLAVGKKTFDKNMKICIQNSILSCEETVKRLGIEIYYQLNFDIHISSICRKASQHLNILKRLGRYLDRLNKLTIFHTFILSNFNFCLWLGIFVPIKIQKN